MSHFTIVKCKIKDLPLLTKAAIALGLQPVERKTVNGYQGQQTTADMVYQVTHKYDVGAVKDHQSGNYNLVADWWGTDQAIPNLAQKLQMEYSAQTLLRRGKLNGDEFIKREVENNGSIRLVFKIN